MCSVGLSAMSMRKTFTQLMVRLFNSASYLVFICYTLVVLYCICSLFVLSFCSISSFLLLYSLWIKTFYILWQGSLALCIVLISFTTFNSSLNISRLAIAVKIYVIYSLSWFFSVFSCWAWQADIGDIKIINNLALICAEHTWLWKCSGLFSSLRKVLALVSIQGQDLAIRGQGQE